MVRFTRRTALLSLAAATACADNPLPPSIPTAQVSANHGAPAPAGVVTVASFGGPLTLWPFTGTDVAGTQSDPINLVFAGQADPRNVRAALMGLDGNRSAFGFPASAPFDCRWSDTPSGGIQATWNEDAGWSGNAIQLQCGDYAPLRFHVRLFRAGARTVGNAHFEVLIPGTADHQVLSWELAKQLVTVDLMRSGLLDPSAPLAPTGAITPAPSFKTIPAIIFNGLPPELQALAAGAPGNVTADVPIANDGSAMAFNIAGQAAPAAGTSRTFTIDFGQVVPKPFCADPGSYVHVSGPVVLRESATIESGTYTSEFSAEGELQVVPVDPVTGAMGTPYKALVRQHHRTALDDRGDNVSSRIMQILLPARQPGHGQLIATIEVDSRGTAQADTRISCGR